MDRASVPVIGDVYVAERGQNEGVVNADVVRQGALGQRNDCSTDDRLHQKTGALCRKRPNPSTPSAKMLGNITELKSPTRMMLPIANQPVLSIDMTTRMQATTATVPSTVRGDNFCSPAAPMKRPIMAPNQ